jgi:hypothetical protein
MPLKHTGILHSKALQNLPKFGFWVRKYSIWQPCSEYLFGKNQSLKINAGANPTTFEFTPIYNVG